MVSPRSKMTTAILTIVAKLALIDRVLAEGKFLQIGVRFRQQARDEHARAGRIERRHRLGRFRVRVSR